jgi:2-(1,2-epoxy-1,2-dihydrophenyl)acetyl-CoA isomerase
MPNDYETILYDTQDRIVLLTLNRPDKLNAWSAQMETEFMDALDRASADPKVHCIVVTGAGRAFCAGGDIGGFNQGLQQRAEGRGPSPLMSREGSPEVPITLARSKPVVAAINGYAVGIGLTMPLACDIRIASNQARFSVRFVRVGLTPECGSTRYLPLVAGLGNALYMALTGTTIEADEALRRGLVDRVVPHDKLMDEAMAVAGEIAANPPGAVWSAKRLMHESSNRSDLRTVVSMEGFAIREARRHPDHAEAVKAFLEKRTPVFGAQGGAK